MRALRTFLPEILYSILALLLVLLWIIHARLSWASGPGLDWNSSEWMINYAAGFVRRGLGGALILLLIQHLHLSFFAAWAGLTTTVYAGISVWFVRAIRRLGGPAVWRAALLFNPLFILFGALSGTFLRKDMIFVAATVIHAEVARKVRASRSPFLFAGCLAVAAALSTMLALLHEGDFLFLWLAINGAILWYSIAMRQPRRWIATLLALAVMAPSLAATGAAVLRHGTPAKAREIRNSWVGFMPPAYQSEAAYPPEIQSLGATPRQALTLSMRSAWQFPLFLLSFLLCGAVAVGAFCVLCGPGSNARRYAALLCFPVLFGIPMAAIAMDWGRWFAGIACCAFPILLYPDLVPIKIAAARLGSGKTTVRVRSWVERHPVFFAIALLSCPLPPWPCPNPLIAYNPFFLLLELAHLIRMG
jgi:hypothetical protein